MISFRNITATGLAVLLIGSLGFSQVASADGVSRAELLAAQCNACDRVIIDDIESQGSHTGSRVDCDCVAVSAAAH